MKETPLGTNPTPLFEKVKGPGIEPVGGKFQPPFAIAYPGVGAYLLTVLHSIFELNPKVANAGGLQSPGVKGEAVISYRNPLIPPTAGQDLKSSGFPARVNNMAKLIPSFEFTGGDILKLVVLL